MTILRIHKKQNNFVILDKTCLYHEKISWAAKGLHAYLISLPDDWKIRVSDLQKRATNGRDAVRAILNELEHAGFIRKSRTRSEETGRFGAMEFLVLEYPHQESIVNSPETEMPSVGKITQKTPQPENPSPVIPAPGYPSTENPTLLNINRMNNNKLNNKTAAAIVHSSSDDKINDKAAAVIFSNKKIDESTSPLITANAVHILPVNDVLIKHILTPTQIQRVEVLAKQLQPENDFQLSCEIQYCLLNPNHFTGCANDFSKKLNAIRNVISRGDWQTPAGMLSLEEKNEPSPRTSLEESLHAAKAEAVHFNRLHAIAKPEAKAQLANFVTQAQQKIKDIEVQLYKAKNTNNNVIPLTN